MSPSFAAALLLPALGCATSRPSAAEEAHQIPAPIIDEAAGAATSETAVLAGDASGASKASTSTLRA